ncbi:MAG: molybdopterin-dependent oxidoreductase [Acidobacteriia bacterium]|nr:molybdopterin-dependent oxidoreductase [Terriglobia bacterium]
MNDKVEHPNDNVRSEVTGAGANLEGKGGAAVPAGLVASAQAGQSTGPVEGDATPVPAPLHQPSNRTDQEVLRQARIRSRRSFLVAGASALAGYAGWRWLNSRRLDDDILWPLRSTLQVNEQLARDYFRGTRLAPTFSLSFAQEPRINGTEGMDVEFDPSSWRLRVLGLSEYGGSGTQNMFEDTTTGERGITLGLEEVKQLPRVEMVTELKCIEGWSQVVQWAGARLADFAARYGPATMSGAPPDVQKAPEDLVRYVSLETPDNGYYVGLDMPSALHPQTLLCYEMNGRPLSPAHGAPLRLVIPVKYGIKNLKRIGTIRFTDQRPADYWAERGYDWYAGH